MSRRKKSASALDVAEYFIKLANDRGDKSITNKKLQKLVYYAQVWSLVVLDHKLFNESIEAWVHGPAIPKVYDRFKSFGFQPIELDLSDRAFSFRPKERELLNLVWKIYGKYDGQYLEALTHSELPWQQARRGLEAGQASQNKINLKLARKFYAAKLESA